VQRWLAGHHAASFTIDTYIGLLNEELPEPVFFDDEPDTAVNEEAMSSRTVVSRLST
jgi:hypothetical protein